MCGCIIMIPRINFNKLGVRIVWLYYLDASAWPMRYVRSAIGIDEEVCNEAFLQSEDRHKEIRRQSESTPRDIRFWWWGIAVSCCP